MMTHIVTIRHQVLVAMMTAPVSIHRQVPVMELLVTNPSLVTVHHQALMCVTHPLLLTVHHQVLMCGTLPPLINIHHKALMCDTHPPLILITVHHQVLMHGYPSTPSYCTSQGPNAWIPIYP